MIGIVGFPPMRWSFVIIVATIILCFPGRLFSASESKDASGRNVAIYGVWGSDVGNVFVVGDEGTIRRYNGVSWKTMTSGSSVSLFGVWGGGEKDIFAVGGGGTILHYSGEDWSKMKSGTTAYLYGIWGVGSDVFVVGEAGTILHYDGSTWKTMDSGTTVDLNAVWGEDANHVFAVGEEGTVIYYSGERWHKIPSATTSNLYGVWGVSASEVFTVGEEGTTLFYDGVTWKFMASKSFRNLHCIWGVNGRDLFSVGEDGTILHYNGNDWSVMSVKAPYFLNGIWGIQNNDIMAVAQNGTILRYDGKSWYNGTSKIVAADPFSGDYVKDDRNYYDLGIICNLDVERASNDLLNIEILAASSRAVCAGYEGQARLKRQRAETPKGKCSSRTNEVDCVIELVFSNNKIILGGGPWPDPWCPFSGTYVRSSPKSTEEIIQFTRGLYNHTNKNLKNYDRQKKVLDEVIHWDGFTTSNSRITCYLENDGYIVPRKITVAHQGDNVEVLEEYYYFDYKPVFCFRRVFTGKNGNTQTKEDRFYLNNRHLIKWLDNEKNEVPSINPGFKAEEDRTIKFSDEYLGLFHF